MRTRLKDIRNKNKMWIGIRTTGEVLVNTVRNLGSTKRGEFYCLDYYQLLKENSASWTYFLIVCSFLTLSHRLSIISYLIALS